MNQVSFNTEPKKDEEITVRKSARRAFIFHWFGWRRFLRDLLIMQVGFFLIGLYIGIVINAGLGRLVPWGLLEYALADSFSIDVGSAYLLITVAALLLAVFLREPLSWGTVASFISVALWADFGEQFVPTLTGGVGFQILYVLVAVLAGAFGAAIYLSVEAGPGPRDALWLAIARLLRVNAGVARTILEVSLVVIGLLLGQPIGLITIIHVITAGPAIWLAFHLFNIKPQAEFWGRSSQSQAVFSA